ncbi:2Fe-2S iron-sulfur cluster-binding protein [Nonomuraea bangladeshensis]|uniref:(2Fe-2S)-binding protein n=1 Tax=Nonomuraea bangladeshensis TaxID=404385 RepID=UPI003C2E1E9B
MTYHMTFRGAVVPAEPGQSVGAALVAAGIRDWRSTRKGGRPRGLFCGIGVCFDCLITVNGIPDRRACLTPAADGLHLTDTPATAVTPAPEDPAPEGSAPEAPALGGPARKDAAPEAPALGGPARKDAVPEAPALGGPARKDAAPEDRVLGGGEVGGGHAPSA